jgi:hypothetical protein
MLDPASPDIKNDGSVSGTQARDNFNFFYLNQNLSYMPLVDFRKNFDILPLIFARILMLSKKFLLSNVLFGPLR